MMADAYRKGLPVALKQGRVTMAEIDTCVRRVLRLKEQLGMFDDPYRRGTSKESEQTVAAPRRPARDVSARAIVTLTNATATDRKDIETGKQVHGHEDVRGART